MQRVENEICAAIGVEGMGNEFVLGYGSVPVNTPFMGNLLF